MSVLRAAAAVGVMGFMTISVTADVILLIVASPLTLISAKAYMKYGNIFNKQGTTLVTWVVQHFAGIELVATGDKIGPGESALLVPNHLTHDWAATYPLSLLSGNIAAFRTVIKRVVLYFFPYGLAMHLCYWPLISRDYNKDERRLTKLFKAYKDYGCAIQLYLYAEGTRRSPKRLAESQKYAKEKGYPVWKHVMLPRHRGFCMALTSLAGVAPTVFDVTLQYEGWKGVPGFLDILLSPSTTKKRAHVHVRRVDASSIPADEDKRKEFLMDMFARKDELLEAFEQQGKFPGPSVHYDPVPMSVYVTSIVFHMCTIAVVAGGAWCLLGRR